MPLRIIKSKILSILDNSYADKFIVEYPDIQWGHFSTNVAMKLYKYFSYSSPFEFAQYLISKLLKDGEICSASVAGYGFINIKMHNTFWKRLIESIDLSYGSRANNAYKVNVEYVSANPTGPLHVGHVRTGVVGDVIANIWEFLGYKVTREFYVNNCGGQIEKLASSIMHYINNNPGTPEYYDGEYVYTLANNISLNDIPNIKTYAVMHILDMIKSDMHKIKIYHDNFVFESEIQYLVPQIEEKLKDYISYQVVKAEKYDVSNEMVKVLQIHNNTKVLQKSDGTGTYFVQDIAYHQDKINRGYKIIINIQGADHIGHIDALHDVINILSPDVQIHSVLCQMVQLVDDDGQIFKMSKRKRNVISIDDILEYMTPDQIRYAMLLTSAGNHYKLNMNKIIECEESNKLFYVQYAHARSVSFLKKCRYRELHVDYIEEHIELIRKVCSWSDTIEHACKDLAPWYLITYLDELSHLFHNLWSGSNRMISNNENKNEFYAALIYAVQKVLKIAFRLINIQPLDQV